jgi:hypothetical protein
VSTTASPIKAAITNPSGAWTCKILASVCRHFDEWRELVGLGNISWPESPPAALGEGIEWNEPQPYVHTHMAVSGAPGRTEEVLTGHLSDGVAKGGMLVTIMS